MMKTEKHSRSHGMTLCLSNPFGNVLYRSKLAVWKKSAPCRVRALHPCSISESRPALSKVFFAHWVFLTNWFLRSAGRKSSLSAKKSSSPSMPVGRYFPTLTSCRHQDAGSHRMAWRKRFLWRNMQNEICRNFCVSHWKTPIMR